MDCYRFKGDLLDHRGDWPGAQRAYAPPPWRSRRILQPGPHYSWGLALARHRDLAAATAKYALANSQAHTEPIRSRAWGDMAT